MYEMDKVKFGTFIAELRKQNGFTQKEVAQRLFVSDKAVSKWERGLSMPDISLLAPLADLLGVTVIELLQGQRMENSEPMDSTQVEDLVKKAIHLSDEEQQYAAQRKRKRAAVFCFCFFAACLEIGFLLYWGQTELQWLQDISTVELLCVIFGCYFSLFVREQLPAYYDENKINAYIDGVFRLNLPGVSLHNSNWPHIIKAARLWSLSVMVFYPCYDWLGRNLLPQHWAQGFSSITLVLILVSLFVPLYAAAKKYE